MELQDAFRFNRNGKELRYTAFNIGGAFDRVAIVEIEFYLRDRTSGLVVVDENHQPKRVKEVYKILAYRINKDTNKIMFDVE